MIPYGRQTIDDSDIAAVSKVLTGEWLTQGPAVTQFEEALARACEAPFAVAMSNGTAALEGAYAMLDLKPGDEVITTPMTFAATANAALCFGAKPVFADIDAASGQIDLSSAERLVTKRTRAIVPVDYTGAPVDHHAITQFAQKHSLAVIEDAAQALGARFDGKPIGSHQRLVTFSFHPVKSITTGEGGAVVTSDEQVYQRLKRWVTHGIRREHFIGESHGPWFVEMDELSHNNRLTDMQCALGLSQLKRLDQFVAARRRLAERYHAALADLPQLALPPQDTTLMQSAWHLYVVRLTGENPKPRRRALIEALRAAGIGATVHHIPVYYHPYYAQLGYRPGLCPVAEDWYERIVTLPLYPNLAPADQDTVIRHVRELV